jgi:hypothetical protein
MRALAATVAAVVSTTGGVLGTWHGTLHQKGTAPFTVTATIRGLGTSAHNTVRYSGLDCRGTWRYLGRSGRAYRFRETITAGRSNACKGVGTVALTPRPGGKLGYVFRGGGVVSRGTLTRARRE